MGASAKQKVIFWIVAGVISVFFAEVVSGSTPFPFFTPDGWLIVFPVYELHIVLITSLIYRFGKPKLYVILPAGMIFGMYETYITKVVWGSAEWARNGPNIFGIYLVPFFLVVLFWHPIMSFILPLVTSEILLTGRSEILANFPERLKRMVEDEKSRRRVVIALLLFASLSGMFNLDPLSALLSSSLSVAFVLVLVYLWKRRFGALRYSLKEYVLGTKGIRIAIVLTFLMYLIFGAVFNPRYFPPAGTHFLTALIYLFFFGILIMNLKRSRREWRKRYHLYSPRLKSLILLSSGFVVITTVEAALPFKMLILAIFLISESALGLIFLIYSTRVALRELSSQLSRVKR